MPISVDYLINEIPPTLRERVKEVRFRPGDILIRENSETPIYIIKEGLCRVFMRDHSGGEVVFSRPGPGMAIGDMSNFSKRKTNANVIAETDVVAYCIPKEEVAALFEREPGLALRFYIQVCLNLEKTNGNLASKVNRLLDMNTALERTVEEQTRDIRRKNDELGRQNDEMRALVRQRDEFLNMAAHDMRSPLASMIGLMDLLRSCEALNSDPPKKHIADLIYKNCVGMLQLINDLLDISRIRAGKLELALHPFSVPSFLEECMARHRLLFEWKGMTLASECENNLPHCRGDVKRLDEIMGNLLSNAVKFSNRGTTVVLRAVRRGDKILFSVQDQGQGIPAAEIPRLFGEFQRLSIQATEGEKGSGLGLAIVHKLVQLHGGEIEVVSDVGKGTTFSFTLPVG